MWIPANTTQWQLPGLPPGQNSTYDPSADGGVLEGLYSYKSVTVVDMDTINTFDEVFEFFSSGERIEENLGYGATASDAIFPNL
jgi:hypothetical protein